MSKTIRAGLYKRPESSSFDGNYAGFLTGIGGLQQVSIMGIFSFDGARTGRANTIWHLPGKSLDSRICLPKIYNFNYYVDENGMARLVSEEQQEVYLVVTKSQMNQQSNQQTAVELQFMSTQVETKGGNLLTGTMKRLPDKLSFNERFLDGVYGGLATGPDRMAVATIGYVWLDGKGSGNQQSLQNLPDLENLMQRKLIPQRSSINYIIDSKGIGRAQVDQGDGIVLDAWFVVTEVGKVKSNLIASEIFVIQGNVDPITGNQSRGFMKRLY